MSHQGETYNLGLTMHYSKQMDQIDPPFTADMTKGTCSNMWLTTCTHCSCSFLTMLYKEIKNTMKKVKKIMGARRMPIYSGTQELFIEGFQVFTIY